MSHVDMSYPDKIETKATSDIRDDPKYRDAPGPLLGYRDDAGEWHNLPPRETPEQIEIRTLKRELSRMLDGFELAAEELAQAGRPGVALRSRISIEAARALLARLEMSV